MKECNSEEEHQALIRIEELEVVVRRFDLAKYSQTLCCLIYGWFAQQYLVL